jgi:hypothetical protein
MDGVSEKTSTSLELFGIRPHLSRRYPEQAPAQQPHVGVSDDEDAARTRTECVNNQCTIARSDQHNFREFRMSEMEVAQRLNRKLRVDRCARAEKRYLWRLGFNSLKNRCQIHGTGCDIKLRPSAKGAGQQLRLHTVGIDDQNIHYPKSGGN